MKLFTHGVVFLGMCVQAFAQEASPILLGKTKEFIKIFKSPVSHARLASESNLMLPTRSGEWAEGVQNVYISREDGKRVIGELANDPQSTFFFEITTDTSFKGQLILPNRHLAFSYFSQAGNAFVQEVDIDKVVCTQFAEPQPAPVALGAFVSPTDPVFQLQSLAGATAVAKLDFDGELVANSYWNGGNPINALPFDVSADYIREVWELVSEDFKGFNINITTNEEVYRAAPTNLRMKCIITQTTTASPGNGGVAYVGSFTWGNDTPCWVFNLGAKYAGEAASHEIGHTLGLIHDGRLAPQEEYYYGQYDWAPIMGVGYYVSLTQWSKGEYARANNTQDDLAIIASVIGNQGYRQDDHGNDRRMATVLEWTKSSDFNSFSGSGIISQNTDSDMFKFVLASPALVSFTIEPAKRFANLNVSMAVLDQDGNQIAIADPFTRLEATVEKQLGEGTYYLEIKGAGEGDPISGGFSNYGCLGAYTLYGKAQGGNGNGATCEVSYEPNDALANAIDFPMNSRLFSTISHYADQDYYRLELPVEGKLTLSLGELGEDYDLALLNANGELLTISTNRGTVAEKIEYNVYNTGTYFVKVMGHEGVSSSICYTLTNDLICAISHRALYFNGVNTAVVIPANEKMYLRSSDFTVEMMVKLDQLPGSIPARTENLVNNTNTASKEHARLFLRRGAALSQDDTLIFSSGNTYGKATRNLKDGKCHHIAIVKKGDSTYFYLDGTLASKRINIGGGGTGNNTAAWLLGANNVYYQQYAQFKDGFYGMIKEFRVWKAGRSQNQIQTYMNRGLFGSEPDLVGYWPLDDGTEQIARDKSNLKVNGVLGADATNTVYDPVWIYNTCEMTNVPRMETEDTEEAGFKFAKLQTYPNPFKEELAVRWPLLGNGPFTVEIWNAMGLLVYQKVDVANDEINIRAPFPAGCYFIKVKGNGKPMVQKVVKN